MGMAKFSCVFLNGFSLPLKIDYAPENSKESATSVWKIEMAGTICSHREENLQLLSMPDVICCILISCSLIIIYVVQFRLFYFIWKGK